MNLVLEMHVCSSRAIVLEREDTKRDSAYSQCVFPTAQSLC